MEFLNKVEALLFASGRYLSEEDIAGILGEGKANVKNALKELQEKYGNSDSSLAIINSNKGWKMSVKEEYHPVVRNIVADTELEKPVLETLAVIAWKRPILQSEVVDMRGDHAYQHIRELMELGFISREKHGRTYKLKLAEKFFEYFDVEGDAEIRELFQDVKRPEPKLSKQEEKKLGELEVVELEGDKKRRLEDDLKQNRLGNLEIQDIDPLEKRRVDQKELDELEKELEAISKRTDETVKELEQYTDDEDDDEEGESDIVTKESQ